MDVKEQKSALRKAMFDQRRKLDLSVKEKYDLEICDRLEQLILRENCRVVHSYIPIAGEIDITPLLQKLMQKGITVICPKTLPKRKLENRILKSLEELETGIMGTKHPLKPELHTGGYDLIIVPGLAVDKNRYRLGYGGAYYDSFLSNHPGSLKVGIFYTFQELDSVPLEPHDVQLDIVLKVG